MVAADEWVYDDELLIEAARYAVSVRQSRNAFMKEAKEAWYRAATEKGLNAQTLRKERKQ